jgi:hypothetical protein
LTDRINSLETKVVDSATATVSPAESVNEPLKEYQIRMLSQLRQLRSKMDGDGGGAASEALVKENGALKEEVSKLNYRIVHLLRALEDAESS